MGNLSLKEKLLFGAVIILIVIVLIWFAVISPLNAQLSEAQTELQSKQELNQIYENLRTNNVEKDSAIDSLEENIVELEQSFVPQLNSDAIVNYIQRLFETNGCPYLSEIYTESIPMDSIILSDGSISSDSLSCLRVTVRYQSTDGYNVPEYNNNPDWHVNMQYDDTAIMEAIAQMGSYPVVGYPEFVQTVTQLSQLNPSAIKISNIRIEDSLQGYLNMTAVIDFYAGSFTDRVSEISTDAPYVTFGGETPETTLGMIGFPIVVENTESPYAGIMLHPAQFVLEERDFAAWWSSSITMTYASQNVDLYAVDEEGNLVPVATEFVPVVVDAASIQTAPVDVVIDDEAA